MSCVISDCCVLSFGETVNKTRLGLIYERTCDFTFSEQFICSFKATLDPSRVSSQFVH